jgi:hypothetical protein
MSISIDVDLDEIYDQMDSWDKKAMLGYLKDDGYVDTGSSSINAGIRISIPHDASFDQTEHLRLCSKLGGLYYRMSDEDMKIISDIIKKY